MPAFPATANSLQANALGELAGTSYSRPFSASKNEKEIWNIIKPCSDLNIKDYKGIFEDLIGFQESESEYKKNKTEGGKKIVISSVYERKP